MNNGIKRYETCEPIIREIKRLKEEIEILEKERNYSCFKFAFNPRFLKSKKNYNERNFHFQCVEDSDRYFYNRCFNIGFDKEELDSMINMKKGKIKKLEDKIEKIMRSRNE